MLRVGSVLMHNDHGTCIQFCSSWHQPSRSKNIPHHSDPLSQYGGCIGGLNLQTSSGHSRSSVRDLLWFGPELRDTVDPFS